MIQILYHFDMDFLSHNLCFSHIFSLGITMGKGIGRICNYDQLNWPYPSPNNTFIIAQRSDTSIQTQHISAYDASVVAHDSASALLDQITNHHGNTDVNNNDDSQ